MNGLHDVFLISIFVYGLKPKQCTESFSWEKTYELIKSNIWSITVFSTRPRCHIQLLPEHLPGQPILIFNTTFHEEIPPDVQTESPLEQLEAGCVGQEANPQLGTTSFQAVIESSKVPLSLLLSSLKSPSSFSHFSHDLLSRSFSTDASNGCLLTPALQ